MFGAAIINVVVNAATVAALRAAAAGSGGQFALCRRVSIDQLYQWNAASVLADDGAAVIKPDSIAGGNPGRWLLVATVDANDITLGTHIISILWDNARAVIRHGENWRCVGASSTHVYFARAVDAG